MNPSAKPSPGRARLPVATIVRVLLAVFGGYAVAALTVASLSVALPLPRPQAVLAATMLAFIAYCAVAIWAFSAATALRAWLITGACAVLPTLHLLVRELLA